MWKWVTGSFVCVAALWIGLWFYAQKQVDAAAETFQLQEHRVGRDWSCAEPNRTGFLVYLLRSCAGAQLSTAAGDALKLAKLQGSWTALQPNSVLAEVTAPLEFHIGALSGTISWANADSRLGGIINQNLRSDTAITMFSGLINTPQGSQSLQIEQFGLSLKPGVLKENDNVLPIDLTLDGVKNPIVAQIFGTQEAVSLKVTATVDHLDMSKAGTLPQVFDRWRQKSGEIKITRFELLAGELTVRATGTLGLDSQHRLAGTLDAEVSGANGVLTGLGLSPKSSLIGKLISGVLSGKIENGKLKGAAVPLRFKDGQVLLGTIPLPFKVEPVY